MDRQNHLTRFITICFSLLFFLVPLVLTPLNSELFEFNKVIVLYLFTTLIFSAWVARIIFEKKVVFTNTLLTIPLLLFLGSQALSTFASIDPHTSIFGYYSRFNGGLLTTICYITLYFAFVSNKIKKEIPLNSFLLSGFLVSVYAVAQHYGIDAHIWVQDVKNRVFSTLGQPNWLASFVAAIIFFPLEKLANAKKEDELHKNGASLILATFLFLALLFTKSRSGILAFALGYTTFITLSVFRKKFELKKTFVAINIIFAICLVYFGTPFTPAIEKKTTNIEPTADTSNYLISESGDIRKIVWKGALNLFKANPLLGTGVETFAFAYPMHRPIEHNLLSEWDFVYNKAHNQYLNFAANSGMLGLGTYLLLIFTSIYLLFKNTQSQGSQAILPGYIALLITNFFGFSVVPTDLLLFLFPALIIVDKESAKPKAQGKLTSIQKTSAIILFLACTYILYSIANYWLADFHYAKSLKLGKNITTLSDSFTEIRASLSKFKNEPVYLDQLSIVSSQIASALKESTASSQMVDIALLSADRVKEISPKNLGLIKSRVRMYYTLSDLDPKYLKTASDTLLEAIKLSPTDPKLYYNLGVLQTRTDNSNEAIASLTKAVELKPNYEDPLLALGLLYDELKQPTVAKTYYQKLLELNPKNETARRKLQL